MTNDQRPQSERLAPTTDTEAPSGQRGNWLQRLRQQAWWPRLKRGLGLVFFALVAYLLITVARTVEWSQVWAALRQRPPGELLLALLLVAGSYAVYSCFDLLGRRYTGHTLTTRRVLLTTFVCYAFNLNLGSLIGGVGFRYRLYSRQGLDGGVITRVALLSMLTNWLGYAMLAGALFWWRPLALPDKWSLGTMAQQGLGMGLLLVALGYLLACALLRQRSWSVRGTCVELPSARLALSQAVLSCANWLLMAAAIYFLLQQKIDFPTVLSVLLVAAIAGVITHVPAGLGVLEAVFVSLLSPRLPQQEVLAALLAYRAMYYLLPLVLATLAYLLMEARSKQQAADIQAEGGSDPV